MRRMTSGLAIIAAGLLALLLEAQPALAGEELVRLATRPGVTQPFWLLQPQAAPVAGLVLFPGGEGVLDSDRGGGPAGSNFLVRVRDRFAAQGFLIALLDVPSDHRSGLGSFRSSGEHAADVAAVIAYLRAKAAVPVWLVGTSRGTISAANAAARLASGGPDGLVLTSSIISPSRRNSAIIGSVEVGKIAVPTLFVHNKEDACRFCSFAGVGRLMEAFAKAPRRELIAVSGGLPPQGDPCEPMSRHGYLGIEDEVVTAIARWIKGGA